MMHRSCSSSPTRQLSRVYSVSIILWWADSFIAGSWQTRWEAAACRSTEHQRYTSFFYSLAELSKSHIFPSLFSLAFSQVIGHFSASFQAGWVRAAIGLTPAAAVIGDGISTDSLGAFSTQPSEERASLKDQETLLKYNFSAPFRPLLSG